MDCSATSLSSASSTLFDTLSHKQLLAALLYVQCTANGMNCTPSSLMSGANCLLCLSEKQLIAALVYIQCINNGGGGGGGGGGGVTCGNYGGGQPNFVPATGCGNAIDTSNSRVWWYFNGNWQ